MAKNTVYHFACQARVCTKFVTDSSEDAQSQWDTFRKSLYSLKFYDGQGEPFDLSLCDVEPEVEVYE